MCSFYDKDAPIYTMSRFLPPSKIMGAGEPGAWLEWWLAAVSGVGCGEPGSRRKGGRKQGSHAYVHVLGLSPAHSNRSPFPPNQPTDVERSILGDGCIIEQDARIIHSVVGLRSIVREVSLL